MNQILGNGNNDNDRMRRTHNSNQYNRNHHNHNTNMGNYYNQNNNYYNYRQYQPEKTNKNSYNYNNDYENKANIKTIVKIFSILLMIFGLALIGQSVLSLTSQENKPKDNPQVSFEKIGKEVKITVETMQPVKQIEYWWNDGDRTKLEGTENIKVTYNVDVPNGNNILNVMIEDYYGNKTNYQKQYIFESSDTSKPVLEIAIVGNKLRIKAIDETNLDYMEYKWNNEESNKINVNKGENQIEQEIEVRKGQNDLTVIAVDKEGNKTERIEKIIGDTAPEVSISTEGTNIVVNAKDDEGIKKIQVIIDGEEKNSGDNYLEQKEVNAKIPVSVGTHSIKATVTNINGLESTKEITANI